MAKIVFMIDLEEGHVLPTFSLARSLAKAHHEVQYMALPDCEELILNAGFDYYPLFAKYYPKGFKQTYKRLAIDDQHRGFDRHFEEFLNGIEAMVALFRGVGRFIGSIPVRSMVHSYEFKQILGVVSLKIEPGKIEEYTSSNP